MTNWVNDGSAGGVRDVVNFTKLFIEEGSSDSRKGNMVLFSDKLTIVTVKGSYKSIDEINR